MQTTREGVQGKKVYLKVIGEGDLGRIYQWKNDLELLDMIAVVPFPVAEFEVREWFTRNQNNKQQVLFGIHRYDEEGIIGLARLMYIDWINSNTELAIYIGDRERRGKGVGTEAVSLLVEFAFNNLNLHRVYLKTDKTNAGAIKSYQKCGFELEGTLRDHHWHCGKYEDMVMMGITRASAPVRP